MALSVSIIVPVYNVEDYIKDCFSSIVGQSYAAPMECLFIDDCGSDDSVEILEGQIKEYDGPIDMRLIHHDENRGLSAARNTGIDYSKGDYVFFLDSDDQLYPKTISSLVKAAIDEKLPDMVLGSYKVSNSDHPINRYRYNYQVLNGQPTIAKAFLSDKLFCMAQNKLVNKNFIVENRLYFKEGIIHEDNLWSFQSFHMAQKVVTIPDISYFYLIRDGSIMKSGQYERSLLSTVTIYNVINNDISNNKYATIEKNSLKYIEDRLDIRCDRLIKSKLLEASNRRQRLMALKGLPDNVEQAINNYWIARTPFLKLLKMAFKRRCYHLFVFLMSLSLLKNNESA